MSSSTPSNTWSNRWLYRCVHGHAHELKAGIREKYSRIEQLRLESGFGLINDRNPGEWNWVPEAEILEKSVSWLRVEDKSCLLPSDDEIQEMCCGHVSPESANAKTYEKEVGLVEKVSKFENSHRTLPKVVDTNDERCLPKSNTPLTTSGRRSSVGREAENAAFKLPISRKVIPPRPGRPEFSHPDAIPYPKTSETGQTGVQRRMKSNGEQFSESEKLNQVPERRTSGIYRHKGDDSNPEIVVLTMEEAGVEPEETSNHISSGIYPKRREDCVHESTEDVTWIGLNEISQTTPIHENARLLERYKFEYGSLLPENLTLLTYFFEPPIQTYKKNDEGFYKDVVSRYVPLIKIKILGKHSLDVEYDETAILDIGCDYSIAPQLGFSKKMTRDIVIRSFDAPEDCPVQLRWRRERNFRGSQYVKIELKSEFIGSESINPFPVKLIVAQSFDMSHIVLGYNSIRPYIPAVDFDRNHLYLIHREEENTVLRFDIEKWTMVEEVICRLENPPKVCLRSSATKLKLYERPNYPNDLRWYPIRNDALQEVAPTDLRNLYNILRLEFSNAVVNDNEFSLLSEDQRYSYPSASGSANGSH